MERVLQQRTYFRQGYRFEVNIFTQISKKKKKRKLFVNCADFFLRGEATVNVLEILFFISLMNASSHLESEETNTREFFLQIPSSSPSPLKRLSVK